jgi:hypothetical protein
MSQSIHELISKQFQNLFKSLQRLVSFGDSFNSFYFVYYMATLSVPYLAYYDSFSAILGLLYGDSFNAILG